MPPDWADYAQAQLDWTLGSPAPSAATRARASPSPPGPDEAQWRWVEQWLPHSAWMLLAALSMEQQRSGQGAAVAHRLAAVKP
ncbi:hypothetical protein [Roseateles saccharophilus]|uniref:hypothetical protein n=1 Tax=Roseateles saccharophilus TaxID=304 RepID=UPI001050DCDF|nr:hypothetical protein [Roseateles saccharophilus]MDG0834551.1 hypothetical protein [Roseateles saccharophilus]